MQQKNKKNINQVTQSEIIQLNDEISKKSTDDQLDCETEVLSSKIFCKISFSKISKKSTTVSEEKCFTEKTEQQTIERSRIFTQFFHNVFSSKTKKKKPKPLYKYS